MDVLLKKYFWVVNLFVIGVCASFAGRAGSHVIEGAYLSGEQAARPAFRRATIAAASTAKVYDKNPDPIIKRNVFCSGCTPPPAQVGGPVGPGADEPQKTSLQLELISTMVCPDDDKWSVAVIRELSTKEKDSGMYAKGHKIGETGALVEKVVSRRVYFRNEGRLEYLELEGGAPAAAPAAAATPAAPALDPAMGDIDKGVTCTGNNCTVEKQLVEKMLANTTMLATAARFVPSIKDGKPNGFKLYAIRPNSIFGKIGLQNGDTIKAINGNEMTTPDAALALYSKLRSASHLSVQVDRRGETVTLDYSIR